MTAEPAIYLADVVTDAIDRAIAEGANRKPRKHLGCSQIGGECTRKLWYQFRWAKYPDFPPRVLRLFNRGHLEEKRFIQWLRDADIKVRSTDPGSFGQFFYTGLCGHLAGSIDGVAWDVPSAPGVHFLLEFKTHGAKSFAQLTKHGVQKSNPEHFAQMQMYMAFTELNHALYLAINKNDDAIHAEFIAYEKKLADYYFQRAELVIFGEELPAKISEKATWYQCQYCDYRGLCHGREMPEVNCRTCAHSAPLRDENKRAQWSCQIGGNRRVNELKPAIAGCKKHVYKPGLINGAEVVGSEIEGLNAVIVYRTLDGEEVRNGPLEVASKEWKKREEKESGK